MRKDFGLAVDAANQVRARLYLGEAGLKTYDEASKNLECVGRDSRVIFRHISGNEEWKKNRARQQVRDAIQKCIYNVHHAFILP